MKLEAFDRFCGALPATTMVVQWGGAHVWKVGEKVFALASRWGNDAAADEYRIGFKTSDLSFRMLCEQDGIVPSPYLGRYQWVQLQQADALTDGEIADYLRASHAMIVGKMSRPARRCLGLESD